MAIAASSASESNRAQSFYDESLVARLDDEAGSDPSCLKSGKRIISATL